MTPDQMKTLLKEAGIPFDERVDTAPRTIRSPLIEKQKTTLRKLEGLLQGQVEADQEKMSELLAALQKIKHGGGS
jgi:hypothetical protein